jgi:hypothetical protein
MDNVVKITTEQLLAMEHDYIRNFVEAAYDRIQKESCDEMVVAHDFFLVVDSLTDFVGELLGDTDNGYLTR